MSDTVRKRVEANITAILDLYPKLFQGRLMEQTLNLVELQYRMLKVYLLLDSIKPDEHPQ